MHSDPIRKALEPYMADLEIRRDYLQGLMVAFHGDRDKDDATWLRWYKINSRINRLGGRWVKATRWERAHWRIPRETQKRDV
jgi:hypothetical protein